MIQLAQPQPQFCALSAQRLVQIQLTCTEPSTALCGELTNVTNVANTPANPEDASFRGWYINLEPVNPTDPETIANSSCRVGATGTTTCTGADLVIARATLQTQPLSAGTIRLKESLPTRWQQHPALCSSQHTSHTLMNATSEARALSGQ